jgi:hypothetical protein
VAPEAETRALLNAGTATPIKDPPPTRYVGGRGVHLAFQTYGAGRPDVLLLPGFVSHVERVWEEPRCRAFLSSLVGIGRLILFGLSDRVGFSPSVDATAQDIGTVLESDAGAASARRPRRSHRRRPASGQPHRAGAVRRTRRRRSLVFAGDQEPVLASIKQFVGGLAA